MAMTMSDDMPLYDRAHLASYTGGDVVLERSLVREFCVNAREQLGSLQNANNLNEVLERAHKLKGAARGIGCWQIAQLCECAERMTEMDDAYQRRITAEISQHLERLTAAVH
jgi:HPt (histidine-containing phosphotransfer) domain-containing protein